MKVFRLLFLIIILTGCDNKGQEQSQKVDSLDIAPRDATKYNDTTIVSDTSISKNKVYSNKRFKGVVVEQINDTTFEVSGKAQIFEATFGWVIEDGHRELKEGYEMTDEGAPAWGNFRFTVSAKKERPNSSLHLILFETSAKDGSRVYELPIFMY